MISETASLCHVRRDQKFDGLESLQWAYLWNIHNSAQTLCETCGRTLDNDVDTCPDCGSDDIDHSDSGE